MNEKLRRKMRQNIRTIIMQLNDTELSIAWAFMTKMWEGSEAMQEDSEFKEKEE